MHTYKRKYILLTCIPYTFVHNVVYMNSIFFLIKSLSSKINEFKKSYLYSCNYCE